MRLLGRPELFAPFWANRSIIHRIDCCSGSTETHTHRQTGFFRCSVPFCSVPCRAVQANGNFLLIKINCSSFPFFLFFLFFCRNRQSAGRHHWPAALADTRLAADSRHRRGVALSPGRCLHSCPSTAGPPADVSGKSALSADQQGPGDGGH